MRPEVLLLLLVVGCTAMQPALNTAPPATQNVTPTQATEPNSTPNITAPQNTSAASTYPLRENRTNLTVAEANTQGWTPPQSGAVLSVSDGSIGARFWLPEGRTVVVNLTRPVTVTLVLVSTDGRVIVRVDNQTSPPLHARQLGSFRNGTLSVYASGIITH